MLESYSGATRIFVMVGHPIAQVKAPEGMARLFDACGHDAIVVPFDVAPGDLDCFVGSLAPLGNVDGLCVTVPHKFAAARHCATLSPASCLLGAVNMMRRNTDGTWHGDMLDGAAQVAAFAEAGATIADRSALLVGAGGAGSAIGLALLGAGVRGLAVHDADVARRGALIERLGQLYPGRVVIGSSDPASFDIVANATPAGMCSGDLLPVDIGGLTSASFVGDVVTVPEVTPLIAAARQIGCLTSTGVDMFRSNRLLMLDFWYGPASKKNEDK